MALWVLKGGRRGEREQRILDHSVVGIGWVELGDLSNIQTRKELEKLYRKTYTGAPEGRVSNHVGQLWTFLKRAKVGDWIAVTLKTRSAVAIGEIISDYEYRDDLGEDMRHTRRVKWIDADIPRTAFDQDLLYTFGSALTLCQAKRNNAEVRVKAIVQGKSLLGLKPPEGEGTEIEERDIEQDARDQIRAFISRRFKGHNLARLVEAVLKAQGFITTLSSPGPDGGVDILAASGPMGFDSPRLCVQVKSSVSPADVTIYRSLKGTMDSFGAEQGLLVSWGGFKNSVMREAANSFFKVRLWHADDLLDTIFAHYERLPDDIQAELPLKRIWALAASEIEE